MANIEKISNIKRENLLQRDYIKTLIKEAVTLQMLNEDDIRNIQIQTLELLDKMVYKYNGLESTSIRKEILDNIMESCMYTVSIYLKKFTPDDAIMQLKGNSITDIYYKGRKQIDVMLNVCRTMYSSVIQNMINTKNVTYNDTILGGIKGFFGIYEPDFNAHDMKITADYPLYNNLIGKLEGIEFIQQYLKSIYYENEFCNMFSQEKIEYLLYRYSNDYKNLIINIFEIVLIEMLACELVKKNVKDLIITTEELNRLYRIFDNKTTVENDKIIDNAFEKLKMEYLKNNYKVQQYIQKNLHSIKARINNGVKGKSLKSLFITDI